MYLVYSGHTPPRVVCDFDAQIYQEHNTLLIVGFLRIDDTR